ncbi:MAG: SUF system Fe-S cluster assembly protein [Salibacteraceae bacterium]
MDPALKKQLEESVIQAMKTVYDPEIPVDIYELGLIYEIKIDEQFNAVIVMTLTSPSCPVAESLPAEVEEKVAGVEGISSAKIDLTWEPPWDKDMMSEEALVELGMI